MDINQKVEALEALVNKHSTEIEVLTEALSKVRKKLLVTGGIEVEDELEALKVLLESSKWPNAVEPSLICDIASEQDKQDRAEGVLDIIIEVHLEKLSFLDFGCGEGHIANQSMSQNPFKVVGYDIVPNERWKNFPPHDNKIFTADWEEVKKNGPYNVVLLYDVLDHITSDDGIVENLKKIRSVLAPNAKIYTRCHPWCSRHATHLYHAINKAFIHLVFTPEELKEMGYEGQPCRQIIHPIASYHDCFKKAGLHTLRKEHITSTPVEPFFSQTPIVAKRIKKHWKKSHDVELRDGKRFPWQLEIQFIDFVLGSK